MSMSNFIDSPLLDVFFRFLLTLAFNAAQMRIIGKHSEESRQNVYSFFIISVVVFFLAHTLSTFEMQLGMAIGMFAVFGIVRYRTEALKPQEMTYLFSAIGIAVINALASIGMGWSELVWINVVVLLLVYVLERFLNKNTQEEKVQTKKISVVLSVAELDQEIIAQKVMELEEKLGLKIQTHQISKIDYTLGTAQLTVVYEI
jgi:membrane protein implicated in regulation of membrane protease activity